MDGRVRPRSRDDDGASRLEELHRRARVEGRAALLDALRDRRLWSLLESSVQDAAIAEAAERLGPAFAHRHTRVHACGEVRHRLACFAHVASGAELMLIPGGDFLMGGMQGIGFPTHLFGYDDPGRHSLPAHPCRIERPFLIGVRPLLQREAPRLRPLRGPYAPELPVHDISWQAARSWLAEAGDGLRLPSEAEWEYAARAGTETSFFWGEALDDAYVWTSRNSDRLRAPAEHADRGNGFGLIDMLGNLPEWCEDSWVEDYESGPANQAPRIEGDEDLRVCRGGWSSEPWTVHCAHRDQEDAHDSDFVGLRLARSLPGF